MKIRQFIQESVRTALNEKLTDVDSDVDLIYDIYFKNTVDKIKKTGSISWDMFDEHTTDTSILKSPDAIKCHEIKPCKILINFGQNNNNYYNPEKSIICFGFSKSAINFIIQDGGGNIYKAADFLEGYQKTTLIKEFKEEKIKGSIHHELAHWIDDVLHNSHITKYLKIAQEKGTKNLGNVSIDAKKLEIQGQIHNIKQLYNKYKDIWDSLTFDDMLKFSTSLYHIDNKLKGKIRDKWRRDLKTRMARENLLGKYMVYS